MPPAALRDQHQRQAFEGVRSPWTDAWKAALAGDEPLQMDGMFRRPFSAPHVELWKSFDCVLLGEMPACHTEETVLSPVETQVAAEGEISCLVAMVFGDDGLPTCFGSRRLRGVC